jgi:hypothetical protein
VRGASIRGAAEPTVGPRHVPFGASIGTGVVLGACFIIADYINAKMTVKELPSHLAERTNKINHLSRREARRQTTEGKRRGKHRAELPLPYGNPAL